MLNWLSDLGFAGLFILGVACFLAMALVAGLLTALGKAGGAFKKGWSEAGDRD